MRIVVFFLLLYGLLKLCGIPILPPVGTYARIRHGAVKLAKDTQPKKKMQTAKVYVQRLDGTQKETLFSRSKQRALDTYRATGQESRYQRTIKTSMLCAALGTACGILMGNLLLAVVLGIGLYFLPLWISRFSLYRYNRFLSDELEVALSLITTSYMRTHDIISAIKENLKNINKPVREVFQAFINSVELVNPNVPAQIEQMKRALDHSLFWQWCDALLLCQNDYSQSATLTPIINKFAYLKVQQMENDTKMMLPMRQAVMMVSLVAGLIPGLKLMNADWYANVMHTIPGQIVLAITAVVIFMSLNKAIELSEPIEYSL